MIFQNLCKFPPPPCLLQKLLRARIFLHYIYPNAKNKKEEHKRVGQEYDRSRLAHPHRITNQSKNLPSNLQHENHHVPKRPPTGEAKN